MEKRLIMCEVCRNNCQIEAEIEDGEVIAVIGNGCVKGDDFARKSCVAASDAQCIDKPCV